MKKGKKARLERAKEIVKMPLPPGAMALTLGRLGFGGWALTPEEIRRMDRQEKIENASAPKPQRRKRSR